MRVRCEPGRSSTLESVANKYVIHFEIDSVSSSVALRAANRAWHAICAEVGADNFDSAAECRDADGTNPRPPKWRGWTDESPVSYRRHADDADE